MRLQVLQSPNRTLLLADIFVRTQFYFGQLGIVHNPNLSPNLNNLITIRTNVHFTT